MAFASQTANPAYAARPRRVAGSVAATGISQAFAMLAGAVLALLVARRFGSGPRTDGFFVAYGVYSLLTLVAQSARTSIAARLVESREHFGAFNAYLGGAVLVFAASAVPFVALAGPLGSLLVNGRPQAEGVARDTLLLLWPAVGGQLFAALAAAMLGILEDFRTAAAAYASGGIVSIAAFLSLAPPLGIRAVPVAVLVGTAVTAVPLVYALRRAGWRPSRLAGAVRAASTLTLGSLALVGTQVLYVVSLALAARVSPGAPTLYTYAYFALGLVMALAVSPVATVLAAPLAATWDRNPASLRPYVEDVFRTGLLVLAPIVAAAALAGPALGRALVPSLGADRVDETVGAFLVLAPSLLSALAIAVPLPALFAAGRYRTVAILFAPVLVLHVLLSAAAVQTGSLRWLAAAATVSSFAVAATLLAALYGRGATRLALALAADALDVLVPAVASFGFGAAVFGRDARAWIVGAGLYAAVVILVMPAHRRLAARLLRALDRRPRAPAQSAPS